MFLSSQYLLSVPVHILAILTRRHSTNTLKYLHKMLFIVISNHLADFHNLLISRRKKALGFLYTEFL